MDTSSPRFVSSDDSEKLLLVVLGLTLLVAGIAQRLQVSAAVGAHNLLSPLRDLFAAVFSPSSVCTPTPPASRR
jgi:CPA2 family monovalent cation:H+ antiporter-2